MKHQYLFIECVAKVVYIASVQLVLRNYRKYLYFFFSFSIISTNASIIIIIIIIIINYYYYYYYYYYYVAVFPNSVRSVLCFYVLLYGDKLQ